MLGHVDLPRMRDGGVGAQVFGYYTLPYLPGKNGPAVTSQIDALERRDRQAPQRADLGAHRRDIRAAKAAADRGARAGSRRAKRSRAARGGREVRAARRRTLGILHLWPTRSACVAEGRSVRGPHGVGRDVGARVRARCGVIVDLATVNRRGFFDAIRARDLPVMVSTPGVSGVHASWRNPQTTNSCARSRSCAAASASSSAPVSLGGTSIDAVVDHVLHVIDVAGEDTPALGSDFDGFVVPPEGSEDVASPAEPHGRARPRRGVPRACSEKTCRERAARAREVPAFGRLTA